MKTGIIYARYSSDSQTEQSIEGQLRICQEYAKNNDILILNTYIDRAMSGTNDNRPDFQRMLRDSNRKEWNYVIVYKFDRFSRNKYEMAIHKKTLKENGTKVISATEFIPDTPEGIIFESMLEGYAEYYSAELSQKIKRGNYETRKKGNVTGGRLPYGYKNVNKKAVIDEEQAQVVRYIFNEYANGTYVKDIISTLTAKGLYYYGKPFARTTVYKLLRNERYIGIYKYNEEIFTNIFPAIVEEKVFNIVREKVKKNHYGKRSIQVEYLLRHKIKCGYCGCSVNAESGTARNGEIKHYYKCGGKKSGTNCTLSTMRKEIVEKVIVDTILNVLNKPQNIDYIIKSLLVIQDKQIKENFVLNNLTKELQKVENSLQNLVNAIEQGIISNTTNKRLHELEKQQEELTQKLLIEKSKTAIKLTENEIKQYYVQALKLQPQALINFIIKEIVLYNDKIKITYNSPIQASPDNSQGFSFYLKTHTFSFKIPQRRLLQKYEFTIEMLI